MFDVFGSVKGFLKLGSVQIDNNIFRLHYKMTVILLVVFSLIVTSRQYIGDPIDCVVEGIPGPLMDTYCWIHSTFTLPKRNGTPDLHPGVRAETKEDTPNRKYHKYYQWVCFVLFFQAILFYIPRYLWKSWEGGKMKMLILDLNRPIIAVETKNERKKLLVDYLVSNLHQHNFYAAKFFFCEVLNFVNVILQIYFIDFFLGGEFTTYGTDVLSVSELDQEQRIDPMSWVFPRVTKCTFQKYGPSGTPQIIDGLCVLPLNIVNEKIYIFLWFWFIILAVASGLLLLYRLAVVLAAQARMYILRSQARMAPRNEVEKVANRCQIGDWFMLILLGKNIDPLIYKEIICDLAHRFDGKGL